MKALQKNVNPLVVIVVVLLSVSAFVFFAPHKRSDSTPDTRIATEMAAYEAYKEQRLPQTRLTELKSGDDYSEKVRNEEVLLVFSTAECGACQKELQAIVDHSAEIKSGMTIYSVMFEDKKTVEQFAETHHLNFPILLDEGGALRNKLRIKYFPTNMRLKNGTIRDAWFGVASDLKDFLKRVNLSRG